MTPPCHYLSAGTTYTENLLRPLLCHHFFFNNVFFSPLHNQARLPSCSSTYSVSEVYFARVHSHSRPAHPSHFFDFIYFFLFFFFFALHCAQVGKNQLGGQILHDQSATMFSVVLKSLYQSGTTMMYSPVVKQLPHSI